jgi:Zn-dependent M28 family amino/carboxypeptidase
MRQWKYTALFLATALITVWATTTQPIFPVDQRETDMSADPLRIRQHVETIVWSHYPRDEGHPENLMQIAAYIQHAFSECSADVHLQTYEVNGREYSNVIAAFGPDTAERIIVGAHYDTAGEQPGADDNASGVAGLIELAQLLNEVPLPIRVELAAYTLEEPPYFRTEFMGSAQHVKLLKQQNARVKMMFALEMIGYFNDAPGSQLYPLPLMKWFYSERGDFIAIVGQLLKGAAVRTVKRAMRRASPLPVYSLNAPASLPGVEFSDHVNFWDAGLPAVMITDTAFYRNEAYHSPLDRPERLDYQRMAMVVEGVYAAVLALANEK